MNRAILITGFNNWGKSTHIEALFGGRQKFYRLGQYAIAGVNAHFTVESQSNDDVGEAGFLNKVIYKLDYPNCVPADLICAFCPTKESGNDSRRILSSSLFSSYSEIHLFLLKYKWDMHAELRINDITSHISAVSNLRITVIGSPPPGQNREIISNLQKLYP